MGDNDRDLLPQSETARCFVAVPMKLFAREIHLRLRALEKKFSNVKWVVTSQTHITLHFFGQLNHAQITKAADILQPVVENSRPISLAIHGVGFFPHEQKPKVIWLGLRGDTEKLVKLQKKITETLKGEGYPIESREFKPHLTVGRAKKNKDVTVNAKFSMPPVDSQNQIVSSVILYESILSGDGPRYHPIKTFVLS